MSCLVRVVGVILGSMTHNPRERTCVGVLVGYVVCGCSGGVLLFRSLVGAVPLALGGLASGFGMGPGVSPPAVAAGTVVGWCVGGLVPWVGVGGLVLGCVVDAGGGVCGWCVWFVLAY